MRKTIIMLCAAVMLAGVVFADAPELKNIMPNSWKKLERLSEAEERAFVSQGEGKKSIDDYKKENYRKNSFDFRVYRETVCGIEFYRLLICDKKFEMFFAQTYGDKIFGDYESAEYDKFIEMVGTSTAQIVFVRGKDDSWKEIENMPIRRHSAVEPISTPWTDCFIFYDLMIRKLNEREIGFFTTEVHAHISVDYGTPLYEPNSGGLPWGSTGEPLCAYYEKIKGQLAGGCRTYFTKRTVDEEISGVRSKDEIMIDASDCLFDPKCPLRYSIQNAFDGDPATSYVENTEDDLFIFDIGTGNGEVSEIAIINGYAQNEKLYKANNRIKTIGKGLLFDDNKLNYQILPCLGSYLRISGVYQGLKYNDTCIAEINLKINGKWLFGDIDE